MQQGRTWNDGLARLAAGSSDLLATSICAMGSSPSSAAGPAAVGSRAWVVMPRPLTNLSGARDRGV